MNPIRITDKTAYMIVKIMDMRVRRSIREYQLQTGIRLLGACRYREEYLK